MKKYVLLVAAVLFLGITGTATACPPCANYWQWTATPCLTTNCSHCGFCSYCCGRFGIGCSNCELFLTKTPAADGELLNNKSEDCSDAEPLSLFDELSMTQQQTMADNSAEPKEEDMTVEEEVVTAED